MAQSILAKPYPQTNPAGIEVRTSDKESSPACLGEYDMNAESSRCIVIVRTIREPTNGIESKAEDNDVTNVDSNSELNSSEVFHIQIENKQKSWSEVTGWRNVVLWFGYLFVF